MLMLSISACRQDKVAHEGLYFTLLGSNETGIDFNNRITESDSVNIYENEYMYNGSGVAVGDFNKDGLPDLFFAGSMVSCRLYINKGNFQFEDVTKAAGLETNQWCTGVNVVDINNDGFDDIYLCSSHSHNKEHRRNLLFVNDGKLHFTEQAEAYGLADTGFATQAAFFDYDKDGDLDMYLLNHNLYSHTANDLMPIDSSGRSPAQDRLYRNDGEIGGMPHPVFTDVTNSAGIGENGYGLGVVITDVNNDNWPDVYVANDYLANDRLWLNNRNGTFTNIIAAALKHQSYNSMGVDAADINNDGLPDIAVMDMLPETNERKKMMFNATNQEKFDMQMRMGYEPEYVRNMLQLNNGVRIKDNALVPFYSEIGQLAGMYQTDWSWSVLMADFDNDGYKDIHITNGITKDVTNNDFTAFNKEQAPGNYTTFGNGNATTVTDVKTRRQLRKNLDEYPGISVHNYFYRNNDSVRFTDKTKDVGIDRPSVSQGAAYVDLDNDGDLDLVVNNMNDEAFVYRNDIRKTTSDSSSTFLAIKLEGDSKNTAGLGAKVTVYYNGQEQFAEQSPVRGFCSAVDQRLHFGFGKKLKIDSLKIVWPDDKMQVVRSVAVNQLLTLRHADAVDKNSSATQTAVPLFVDVTASAALSFVHKESPFFDYAYQRRLPQKFSQLGPCIAAGDMNGDGLEDFYVGGAAYQSGKIFFQQANGDFVGRNLSDSLKQEEDLAVQLFDADSDGDLDLLVSGGSTEFMANSRQNNLRFYRNDGKGNFSLDKSVFPQPISAIAKSMAVADYDGDGDLDVYVAAYVLPQRYPEVPQSYLLQNNNGRFTDVTSQTAAALQFAGNLSAAVWADINGDRQPDLIICGDWMPIRFFLNDRGKFSEITATTGLDNSNGMWRSLQAADIDNDGDIDFVAGNMGLNNKYHATASTPTMLYAKDIDNNGTKDLVPAYYIRNSKGDYALYPGIDRNQLSEEIPSVKKKYLLHKDFANLDMPQFMEDYNNKDWMELQCHTMQSAWIENLGNNTFKMHSLPLQAQFAPINAIVVTDVNNDGKTDLLLAGNEYQADAMTGRYDASYGILLLGDSKGNFSAVDNVTSGLMLDGDVKSMQLIHTKKGRLLISAVNDAPLKAFSFK